MERGPTALFGAIVAVGLGPALWLGAQVGAAGIATTRPPAVISEHDSGSDKQLLGGTGAGDDTTGGTTVIHSTPRANVMPLTAEPTVKPSSSAGRGAKPAKSASPTPSESVDPSPSGEPSGTPSQSSSAPVDPPSGGVGGDETDHPITPLSPPASDGDGTGGDNGGGDSGGSGGDSSTGPTVDRSSSVS